MKKKRIVLVGFLSAFILYFVFIFRDGIVLDFLGVEMTMPFTKEIEIPLNITKMDNNDNGVPDALDIVFTSRKEVEQRTPYKSVYYDGGYPPNTEGVCTDVVWRGLLGAGINLKDLMDADIAENTKLYPRVGGNPDPNIDFRRVPNQAVFFERYSTSLTTELIEGDIENLKDWQPGDIVVFLGGEFDHVGIISDKRTKDGIPYLIHNTHPYASEIKLTSFRSPITGHYRWNF
ncbi:DUF1287 domain-containing protein [Sutcliffiella rhizosphaerae]|uniref:DUF1287 domain-containing protein n=1 Tax=Sutcliffiella rhizosphaerae TaxID=2880967 RepID=A0ABN8A9P0_9BACI|nr:DUF1287 domain-containing protein [Sutcliffiella rhizosphaerae]CAG9621885.1 hypothetical protein BACCIP111883_02676 [Sutcliffiella rhizosphaerae]